MHSNPNPKLPGTNSGFYKFVRSIVAGNDITITDLGNGVWQVAYAPQAPSLLSIQQDYNDYTTIFGNQIAAYAHDKNATSDNDSYIYTMMGYGDTATQTIRVQLDSQDCGTFVTTAVGGFQIRIEVLVRNVVTDDCDVYTYFQGAGLSSCQPFTNLRGNQLVLSYTNGKTIDPFFDAGLGNVEITGFNATYKPAGTV